MKEFLRSLGDVTIGPPVALLIRLLIRLLGLPRVRAASGDLFDALRAASHKNYEDRARAKYQIAPSVYWGEDTLVYGDGQIAIGDHSYIGKRAFLLAHPAGTKLTIGKSCSISHNVHIRTEANKKRAHYADDLASEPFGLDVTIGDYVWIGANVFIGGGIAIGSNSIIGANSVVTSDVPENAVYAGVPARQIALKTEYENPRMTSTYQRDAQ